MADYKCVVPGCKTQFPAETAYVPDIAAIRKVTGKAVDAAELGNHTICPRHNRVAREQGVRTFKLSDTLKVLGQRAAEGRFLTLYAAVQKVTAGSKMPAG